MPVLKQETITAKDIEANDGIMFGNEMYRVYYAVPNDDTLIRHYPNGDTAPFHDHIEVALISDKRIDLAGKIMISLSLHKDHPVSVVRAR